MKNPWWIPVPILGRVPADVTPNALRVLGIVSFALFFEHYDTSLLNNALKLIKDDLDIAETSLGYFQMIIRLGALPAFFLIPLVDRIGRRKLFLWSLVGMSLGTLLTGLAQSAEQFVACQMLTRLFVLTASAVSIVIVAEEMPATVRGWGIGALGAVSAMGHGVGAMFFGLVDVLPYGWRALYVIGVLPIALLPMFARNLTETRRFAEMEHTHARWWSPIKEFAAVHSARAAGILFTATAATMGHIVAITFTGYYVLEYHGWAPYQLSIMVIAAGLIGVVGNVIAGRFADRYGRRSVGCVLLLAFPMLTFGFYNSPGWILPAMWSGMVFTLMGAQVIIRALGSELFPTSHRGTSTGVLTVMEAVGAALGLFVLALLQQAEGDIGQWIPLVGLATIPAAMVLLLFPETKQQELEEAARVSD